MGRLIERYDPVRKERYVEALCLGHEDLAAARLAGFKGNLRTVVRKLNDDDEVRDMIAAHRAAMREQHRFDRDKAVRMLMEAFGVAQGTDDARGMIAAVRELNEMHGLHAPKQVQGEVKLTTEAGVRELAQAADAELLELLDGAIEGEFEVLAGDQAA